MAEKKHEEKEEVNASTENVVEENEEKEARDKPEEKKKAKKKPDKRDEKISALEQELSAQKDKYMRLAAEYDNYRKRTASEKLSIYDDATAKAVEEILPVADSLYLALDNLKNSDPEILKGIELVSNQLEKSFEKLKIEGYGEKGDEFDPNIHNAVSKIEDAELGENTVAAVFQRGYKIGDKIIRHAMVQVANCG